MGADFEAEGLLEDLDDPEARRARLELLRRLEAEGVPLEELRRAVTEERLALLPVERVLASERGRLTAADVAEAAGLELDFLDALWRALGLRVLDPDTPAYGDRDVDAARTVKGFLDAGLPPEGVLEVARVLGRGMATLVTTVNEVVTDALLEPGDTELDLALRWADAARVLAPQLYPLLGYVLDAYRLEQVRQGVASAADLRAGRLAGAQRIAVCFADLVGFTRLGERVPPAELGAIAGRLSELAADVVQSPVQVVKEIGDAVMLVSPDADRLLDAALTLLERAEAEGPMLPQLRIGLALGEALRRSGDWYGRPVNLASRVTAHARPGSVLATADVREAAAGEYRWSDAGRRHFRGVRGDVPLYRVRQAEPPAPA